MSFPLILLFLVFGADPPEVSPDPATPSPGLRYAQAVGATPVYTTRDFPRHLGDAGALTRGSRLYRGLAFTAYPGVAFTVHERVRVDAAEVLRVTTAEFPSPKELWLDARHVRLAAKPFPERRRKMPPRAQVLRFLEQAAARAVPYCWGCNFIAGVPRLRAEHNLTSRQLAGHPWDFAGLDCSGLLYEATDGSTPRDTSLLLTHGAAVPIRGLDKARLLKTLVPLDLIVWEGHMLIVLEHGQVVESVNTRARRFIRKTVKAPLAGRLHELLKTRRPVDDYHGPRHLGRKRFVVRRWYPTPTAAPGVSP